MSFTVKKQVGFTIVELLIVIVVIAILATISIVVYNGVQNRAYNVSIQSDLKNIATKIELYKAEQGVYPAATTAALQPLSLKATKSAYDITRGVHASLVYNLLYCVNPDRTLFGLVAKAKSGDIFQYAVGSVGVYGGPIQSSQTENICASVGVPGVISSSNGDFIWLYSVNAWQIWVGN